MKEKRAMTWTEVRRAVEIRETLHALAEGIRFKNDGIRYPIVRMTHAMADEGYAFINCGADNKNAERIRLGVMESQELRAFLDRYKKYNMTAMPEEKQKGSGSDFYRLIRLEFHIRDAESGGSHD